MAANSHTVEFYGLSTCIHCKHAREFLEKRGQKFDLHYVDRLEGEERAEALETVKQYNPQISFPTIIVDSGQEVIIGFKPEAMEEALEL